MSESEAVLRIFSLDFVPAMAVECWGRLMGRGRILLSVDLARSQLFLVNLCDGRTPFRFVTSGSHQKRNSKAEPWGIVKGHRELWLKIGA